MSVAVRRLAGRMAAPVALLLLLVLTPGTALAASGPVQVSGQTVPSGHLRVQVLSSTMLRLEYAAGDGFDDRPNFNAVHRSPGRIWFTARASNREPHVRTGDVTLHY